MPASSVGTNGENDSTTHPLPTTKYVYAHTARIVRASLRRESLTTLTEFFAGQKNLCTETCCASLLWCLGHGPLRDYAKRYNVHISRCVSCKMLLVHIGYVVHNTEFNEKHGVTIGGFWTTNLPRCIHTQGHLTEGVMICEACLEDSDSNYYKPEKEKPCPGTT